MLEKGMKKLVVGYEAPVLWRKEEPYLIDNFPLAQNRVEGLIQRFKRAPDYERKYRAAMTTNFQEGYAVRISLNQIDLGPAYNLSHFGVFKGDNKEKLRIVYDAAAKYRGKCLNDSICSGPTLQNPLPSVLIKFREEAVAWSADIKAMFSFVRLSDLDANFHRFLWPDEDGTTSICRMTRAWCELLSVCCHQCC